MAAAIPTQEPASITAGDTAKWTRSLSDYPASEGWVLSYAFLREVDGQLIQFSASASGADHLVNVAYSDTQLWSAGSYNGQAYVTKAGERYCVWQGRLTVLANFVGAGAIDTRSRARKILDFIDGNFEKLAGKQAVAATIEGVQLQFRNLDELTRCRNYWASIVASEEAALSGRSRKSILARFTRPQ